MNWALGGRILNGSFEWAWEATLSGSLLIVLVWTLRRVCRGSLGVRGCYWLSLLVLLRLVWPMPLTSRWGLLSVPGNVGFHRPMTRSLSPSGPAVAVQGIEGANNDAFQKHPPVPGSHPTFSPNRPRIPNTQANIKTLLGCGWLAGALVLLAAAGWQHRRFSKWLRTQPEITDDKILSMLAAALTVFQVRKPVRIVRTARGMTPALLGWAKPCLLLPERALSGLSESELRMVLLHEVAHVKRHDVLLNWLMIVGRSVHWCNPLVWMAMRQLRLDRELVCDAMVLGVLKREEQPVYGEALIKLLELFSTSTVASTAVAVVHNKQEIKRRLSMIPKFAPTARATWTAVMALLAVLFALTFTRAAEQRKKMPTLATAPTAQNPAPSPTESQTDLKRLEERLAELDARLRGQQQEVDHLRSELAIPADVAEGPGKSATDPETIRMAERERVSADAQAARYEVLLKELKSRTPAQLIQAIPTAVPDTELTQLLRDLNTAENAHARLSQDFGPESAQVKAETITIRTVRAQIDNRVTGILDGMAAQVAAQRASSDLLVKQLRDMIQRDAELAQKYRPYFHAKSDLAILQRVRDELMLQVVQRHFGSRERE